ncbi:MAG: hypothetical protein ACYC7J_12050 [Syntrophales bacterium]
MIALLLRLHPARLFPAAALVGLIITGCAAGRVASPAAYATPEAALRELAASPAPGAITATARVEISSPTERYPLKAAVMLRMPADLRLESIPLLGPPDFFLSIEAGELRVFLPEKGAYHIGPAARQNIARLLRLPLSAAEVVALLMGRLPAEGEGAADVQGEQEEGLYRVDQYRAGKKIRSLWVDPATALLIRVQTFTGGEETAYTAEFADHLRMGDGFLPQRLTISGEGVSLAVRYTDTRLLDDETASFSLPVPEGVTPTPFAAP